MGMIKRGGRVAPSTRRALIILPIWLASLIWMWSWWLTPARINYLPLFIALTLAMLYEFAILPTTFMYFVLRAKRPPKKIAPKGYKVAVITLCVPKKESIDIIERQLEAMSKIKYPHDSWILDEGNSPVIKALARKYGVKHFSRRGISKYNKRIPPFKAKTKAGNVNAWLDRVKRYKYDYFVQFDIDHLAKPNYLNKTLGYFKDSQVAWVQAPSVYKNRGNWIARGAAEQELVLQGPLQMGFYGHSQTPFIIGSHCTYRMSAIREIGGFQPTRAEDHLDTVMLSSLGYRGVFVPEIIAEGDGPETLNTYLAQQFAWAYSMFQVLLGHTPTLLKTMPFRKRWQFLFAQTWYPLWSMAYFTMFITPVLALTIGRDVAKMQGHDFFWHFIPMFICSFFVWWVARPLMQPSKLMLSWRGMILHVVRWPAVLKAVISASFKVKKSYMITPKGSFSHQAPTLVVYKPFLLLGIISALSVLYATVVHGQKALSGQTVFALSNACLMLTVCLVDINIRLRQTKSKLFKFSRDWLKPIAATSMLGLLIAGSLLTSPIVTNQLVTAVSPPAPVLKPVLSIRDMNTAQLTEQLKSIKYANRQTPSIGIYNEKLVAQKTKQQIIQHTFTNWNNERYLAEQLLLTLRAHNTPLVTIEPKRNENGAKLLVKIANGQYDTRLDKLSRVLGASNKNIYVRFAHEMDLENVYTWGNQDPELFIAAFKHVVNYMRSHGAANVKWVWSPAGNPGAEDYYPGNKYVDVVGTTVLYDQYWYGNRQLTFRDLAQRRVWLNQYGKPVWIAEFGAGSANTKYQQALINDALKSYKTMGFKALVYLNMKDANIKGPDYTLHKISEFADIYSLPQKPVAQAQQSLNNGQSKDVLNSSSCNLSLNSSPLMLINYSTLNPILAVTCQKR